MTTTETELPKYCRPDAEPPMSSIFDTLRRAWKKAAPEGETRKYQDLAVELSGVLNIKVTPQKLSQWATGTDNRRPRWSAIQYMCWKLGMEVVLGPDGARLIRVSD